VCCEHVALFLCASFLTCVRIVATILVLCVFLSLPYACAFLVKQLCKGERLQLVEIPHKRENMDKEENRSIQVDHWIT
jgi:hypothetical protein